MEMKKINSGRLRAIGYDARARMLQVQLDGGMNQSGQTQNNSRRSSMLTKMLHPAILILLALAPLGVGHAADMAIDCRLQGGTVVQLPAAACKMEGGVQVNEAASLASPASPASVAMPESAGRSEEHT